MPRMPVSVARLASSTTLGSEKFATARTIASARVFDTLSFQRWINCVQRASSTCAAERSDCVAARLEEHQIVAEELIPGVPCGVLSGPSFAMEVAQGLPTAIT